jgi:hypothetical protein
MEKPQATNLVRASYCRTRSILIVLDPDFVLPSFKSFGHNGFSIGHWWPMLKAVHRDGAHGSSIDGISGTVNEGGAWSIVVSGKYRI